MKAILHRFSLAIFLLIILSAKTYATTYDWAGTSLTGGVYNWNNKLNWKVGGVTATALPGVGDIVQIAVNPYTNDPTITDVQSCASIIFGSYGNVTLTVNGTLTVVGNITQNNDPNFYQTTTLVGTGTIICNNFNVGDNTQPNSGVGAVVSISSKITQLTINGNIVLNSAGNAAGNGIEYPFFSLDANKLSLYGKIITNTFSNPLSGGVDDPLYPGIGLFQADSYSAATTLELLNPAPVTLPITTGFTVDFTNNGPGTGTVIYDAPSGIQFVYGTGTTGLGVVLYNYDYLVFGGASTKQVLTGPFTVGHNWTTGGTGPVDLTTYNPVTSVGGNWINSTTVTQKNAAITVSGVIQNSNIINLGGGTLTAIGAVQNSGTINCGTGLVAVSGAFQNNGTFVCGAGNVMFKGGYTNNSVFTPSTGAVYFSGTSQTIVDNSTTGTIFNTVVFNCAGTVTMGAGVGNFAVSNTGILTMVSPAKLVAGTASVAYLTLKSNASSSASVAAMSGTSSITGNVNVERYLTGGSSTYRSYRLLSSPVYASVVNSNNVYSINYLKNSCYLTGTTDTTGGFDKSGHPTIYLFRENIAPALNSFSAGNFRGINNINSSPGYLIDGDAGTFNIPAGNGFLFFFRGDRSTSLVSKTVTPFTNPENTTLTTTGTLNQGQVTVHNWYTPASPNLGYTTLTGNTTVRGFNLVGNPYASSINWDLFNTTTPTSTIYGSGVSSMIYVFDPSSRNYGVYVKGVGTGTHNTSAILPSGQGFFVITTSATAQLIFNESAKVVTQVTGLNLLMGKPVDYTNNQLLRLQLVKDSVNNDDIVILFNNNVSSAYTPEIDAPYKQGYGDVSLASLSSDNIPLAISQRPLTKTSESIGLSVNVINDGNYQLNMKQIVAIPKLYDIWLMDAYKKDSIDMRQNPIYSFNVLKGDTNSFGSKRFTLVLRQNPAYVYRLISFVASKANATPASRKVQLIWTTENEQNYTHFTVERSIDGGKTFDIVGGVSASDRGTYSIMDKDPRNQNLYRLKQEDINNNITYSKIIPVAYSDLSNNLVNNNNINVYPNPSSTVINLALGPDIKAPSYLIHITNSTGLVVKEVTSTQPTWQGSVRELLAGTYIIKVINNKDQTLIGQTKFVKL